MTASLVMFSTVIAASIYAQLPATVVDGLQDRREAWTRLYPQGWQFFTKAPDDPEATVYAVGPDGGIANISEFPNSRLGNFVGFGRAQRAQGTELAAISLHVNQWTECSDYPESDCVVLAAQEEVSVSVANPSDVPTICGDIIIVGTIPVPWEFRHSFSGFRVDDVAAHVMVEC
jgi:antimicrobial peptide system SdpA family protein